MNSTISKYLRSDIELKTLLKQANGQSKITPFVPENRTTYPYLTFEASPFLADQVTNTYKCDIRILTKGVKDGLLESEKITKRLFELLHFRNNSGFTIGDTTIYHSKHIGGGLMFDDESEVYQQLLIFHIKTNI